MAASTSLKNSLLNTLRNSSFVVAQVYVSAHTADPGDTGASEVTGGSPAYARQALNFSAAASGSMSSSNSPVLDIPASTTVTHLGFWTASSGGTYLGSDQVTTAAFVAQGTYTVTSTVVDVPDA